ncbi:MAG: glycerophosphodiester phosphodiesterase [Chakrabartia sp.]
MMAAAPPPKSAPKNPIVIAHRGASGLIPEHTLAAYAKAIEDGADYIEPDLVMTKDGVLIIRHENEISGTTDIAAHPEFAKRKTTKKIDGQSVTGWFTEDFTLAELKTLRARERLPQLRPGSAAQDGRYGIATFQEAITLVRAREKSDKRQIGLYPETKHSSYFKNIGLPLESKLLSVLKANGYSKASAPIFIQSFEVKNLQTLRTQTKLRLVQLIDDEGGPADRPDLLYADMVKPAGLAAIALYANGIGVAKALIQPRGADQRWTEPTSLIADAHRAGLLVHSWTFRAENYFLPIPLRSDPNPAALGDMASEIRHFAALGADGVFSDHPGDAVKALR